MNYLRKTWGMALLALVACVLFAATSRSATAQDKDSFTPMALDAGFGHMNVSPPATPPEEIIQKFAAKETEFQEALNHYTYRRVARVQTIDDDTKKVDGEWYQVDDVVFTPDGKRTEKTVFAPESTLERVQMSPSDLQDIQHGYSFPLTQSEIPAYDIKYVGKQKVDEIDCYVFDVSPKQIVKNHRYLLGRIWVDTTDLQIVVTDGRMVPDDTKKGSEDLHPPFMTWRAQVDGHYWFPVYTKGEGILHFAGGHGYMAEDVHIKDVIKYTDYKRFGSTMKIVSVDGEAPDAQKPATSAPNNPKKPK